MCQAVLWSLLRGHESCKGTVSVKHNRGIHKGSWKTECPGAAGEAYRGSGTGWNLKEGEGEFSRRVVCSGIGCYSGGWSNSPGRGLACLIYEFGF